MSQDDRQEGCFRAHLKPGQEQPEPLSDAELAKAVQEGKVLAVVNGKRWSLLGTKGQGLPKSLWRVSHQLAGQLKRPSSPNESLGTFRAFAL